MQLRFTSALKNPYAAMFQGNARRAEADLSGRQVRFDETRRQQAELDEEFLPQGASVNDTFTVVKDCHEDGRRYLTIRTPKDKIASVPVEYFDLA